jgi:hypothetical protein
LTGADIAICAIDATVPSDAPYGNSHAIRIENLRVNEDVIPSVADLAVHHAVFLSDTSGNGQFTALDAAYLSRVVIALDTGFDAHQRIDPVIVGDVTGDGTLSGQDAASIAQNAVGIVQPEIPDDPDPLSAFVNNTGPQRTVSIQSGQYRGVPGATVEIPIEINDAEGLLSADLEIGFDTMQLTLNDVHLDDAPGQFMEGWMVFVNPNNDEGTSRIAVYSTMPHATGQGNLLNLMFDVEQPAPAGTTVLDVEGELNEGRLEIIPVDGDFTVLGGDFNNDGQFDCADIDALVAQIASGGNDPFFDLTGDSIVDLLDRNAWLAIAAAANGLSSTYLVGDANLDGVVDGLDFIAWNDNKFTSVAAWCDGDFNADGIVDGLDFILWNENKFQSSAAPLSLGLANSVENSVSSALATAQRPMTDDTVADSGREKSASRSALGSARVDYVFAQIQSDRPFSRRYSALTSASSKRDRDLDVLPGVDLQDQAFLKRRLNRRDGLAT